MNSSTKNPRVYSNSPNDLKAISSKTQYIVSEFCYNHLPKRVERPILSVLSSIYLVATRSTSIIQQFSLPICLLHGKEKHSKKNLTIIFIGNDGKGLSYLSNILFSDKPKMKKIGKTNICNLNKGLDDYSSNVDAVFINVDRFYNRFLQKHGFVVIPEWVSMTLDVSGSIDEIYKKFNKKGRQDFRKVEKNGYSYEFSTDLEKLNFFYHKMYLPYAYQRYGKLTNCENFSSIRHLFEVGKLMLIKDGDEYVYGSIISQDNKDTARVACSGRILKENVYLDRDLGTASKCLSILWAKENDVKLLDFGPSRAFLNDGVLQHKRKWGMTVNKSRNSFADVFGFKPCNDSRGIQSFLVNNPFIYMDKNHFKALVFVPENYQPTPDEIQHFKKVYFLPGLSELIIAFPQDLTSKTRKIIYTTK